jgi:peptidoglycan/xylan/chitin deacetylase (PgdA/CDA1 family)
MQRASAKYIKTQALKLSDKLGVFCLSRNKFSHLGTILMYHGFCGTPQDEKLMPSEYFEKQLMYLKSRFAIVSLRKLIGRARNKKPINNMVALTIDDGFDNFYQHAFPILKRETVPATVFLITDFIDRGRWHWPEKLYYLFTTIEPGGIQISFPQKRRVQIPNDHDRRVALTFEMVNAFKGLSQAERNLKLNQLVSEIKFSLPETPPQKFRPLTWAKVKEMASDGIEFGPHTCSHPSLAKLSLKEAEKEITASRKRLEEEIGSSYNIFCYPFGKHEDFDHDIVALLRKQGYIAAVTGEYGFVDLKTNSLMSLPRIAVQHDFMRFKQDLNKFEMLKNLFRRGKTI